MFPREETESRRGRVSPWYSISYLPQTEFLLKRPLYVFAFTAELTLSPAGWNLYCPIVIHLRNPLSSCAPE